MMSTEQPEPKKQSLIQTLLSELNKDGILGPCIDTTKSIVKPYYIIHLVIQIVMIILLLFIIYKLMKK